MKGLILKDLYVILKQMKYLLLIIALFTILLGYTFGAFLLLYCAMLPITTIGYDERAKWDEYAATMPYSRKDIVLSKYLLGLMCIGVAFVLVFIGSLGFGLFTGTGITAASVGQLLVMLTSILCITLIFMALNLSIIFKWGVEKGRMIFIAGIAAFASIIAATSVIDNTSTAIQDFFNNYFYLFILGAVAILGASIPLSVSFYKKREL
jgi:ABC-2 type transport system permease protein